MKNVPRHLLLGLAAYMVTNSCFAFQQVALGTGNWWGEYSFKWAMLFFTYMAFCIGLVFSLWVALYQYDKLEPILERLLQIRNRMGPARFGLALLIFIAPIWFLQYTPWGIVF